MPRSVAYRTRSILKRAPPSLQAYKSISDTAIYICTSILLVQKEQINHHTFCVKFAGISYFILSLYEKREVLIKSDNYQLNISESKLGGITRIKISYFKTLNHFPSLADILKLRFNLEYHLKFDIIPSTWLKKIKH